MSKEKNTTEENVIDLRDRVEVEVTKKGAALPHNEWKEGDKVKMHRQVAEHLKKNELVK